MFLLMQRSQPSQKHFIFESNRIGRALMIEFEVSQCSFGVILEDLRAVEDPVMELLLSHLQASAAE
jgi:hypothetical protein